MKAVVYTKYGPPEVLQLQEVEKPAPKANEVLIKVHATTVTAIDSVFRQGKPFISRLFTGLIKPRHPILGDEFAGEIEAAGKDVTLFKNGDQVWGTCTGYGAYAEYICLPEVGATLATIPNNLSYDQAAGSCDGFLTALPFLRDNGQIQSGQKVLIYGASGSVGTAAVQIARNYGVEVTGVCSSSNLKLVKSIGAEKVIDYTKEDFTKNGVNYHIIFDTVGKITFSDCKNSLTTQGIFLEAAFTLSIFPRMFLSSIGHGKKIRIAATGLRPPEKRTKDLIFLKELMETGKIKPVLDRHLPMEQISEAHRYVDKGHKKGNVVITVE